MLRALATTAALVCAASPAFAQADADSAAYFAPGGVALFGRPLSPYGDVRLSTLHASPLPPGRADGATAVHENDARVRGGVRWTLSPRVEVEAGAALTPSAWARDAAERRALVRLDGVNEPARPLVLDRAALWVHAGDAAVAVGQAAVPWRASSLVWDADLRPLGVALTWSAPTARFDMLHLGAGAWRARHVDTDDVRLAAAEARWSIRDGAARGADLAVATFLFGRADSLVRVGLGRQNRVASGRFATDYRIAIAQLGVRTAAGAVAAGVHADAARNLSAGSERDAVRVSLTLADADPRARIECGAAYQSVEREAVLGAFASDEWWFRSRMTGGEVWIAARPSGGTQLRLRRHPRAPRWRAARHRTPRPHAGRAPAVDGLAAHANAPGAARHRGRCVVRWSSGALTRSRRSPRRQRRAPRRRPERRPVHPLHLRRLPPRRRACPSSCRPRASLPSRPARWSCGSSGCS